MKKTHQGKDLGRPKYAGAIVFLKKYTGHPALQSKNVLFRICLEPLAH